MPRLSTAQLAALDTTGYMKEVKSRLRDDERWLEVLDPALARRTRWTLEQMLKSIDRQKARVLVEGSEGDEGWLVAVNALRRFVARRLEALPPEEPISATQDARRWRTFSAHLAQVLEARDPAVLEEIQMPYGKQSAAQWLAARKQKQEGEQP